MFSKGKKSNVRLEDIKVTDSELLSLYLNVNKVPCIINSPLRQDNKPSFGLYSLDGKKVYYKDLSTGDKGGMLDLLGKLWHLDFREVLIKIESDFKDSKSKNISIDNLKTCEVTKSKEYNSDSTLECKIREWRNYDLEYWKSYGISLLWLKLAEVYPISHKIITKNGHRYVLPADKYAYAYVEHKENKVTLKIYQPFNKAGYKWSNKHDSSVVSLWTKVPEKGEKLCICSSLKDALCLWANTGIPALAVQGEGYYMSETALNVLKSRYEKIYVLFDNDEPGLIDGEKFAEHSGFINIVLPKFSEGKDISDYYKSLQDKEVFKTTITNLFN